MTSLLLLQPHWLSRKHVSLSHSQSPEGMVLKTDSDDRSKNSDDKSLITWNIQNRT